VAWLLLIFLRCVRPQCRGSRCSRQRLEETNLNARVCHSADARRVEFGHAP
jgi:hypothetical protein